MMLQLVTAGRHGERTAWTLSMRLALLLLVCIVGPLGLHPLLSLLLLAALPLASTQAGMPARYPQRAPRQMALPVALWAAQTRQARPAACPRGWWRAWLWLLPWWRCWRWALQRL
jgi:hypothetical protein